MLFLKPPFLLLFLLFTCRPRGSGQQRQSRPHEFPWKWKLGKSRTCHPFPFLLLLQKFRKKIRNCGRHSVKRKERRKPTRITYYFLISSLSLSSPALRIKKSRFLLLLLFLLLLFWLESRVTHFDSHMTKAANFSPSFSPTPQTPNILFQISVREEEIWAICFHCLSEGERGR